MNIIDLPDYGTVRFAVPITNVVGSYIRLPSFSISNIDDSVPIYVVVQFNYSASGSFFIKPFPALKGLGFMLCVRYTMVDGKIYRYKLWDDPLFNLPNVPLYNNNLIKKHFVLEVWKLPNTTSVSLSTDVLIPTTIKFKYSDLYYAGISFTEQEFATEQTINILTNVETQMPPEWVLHEWDASNAVLDVNGKVINVPDSKGTSNYLRADGDIGFVSSDVWFSNKPTFVIPPDGSSRLISQNVYYATNHHGGILIAFRTYPTYPESSDYFLEYHIGKIRFNYFLESIWYATPNNLELEGDETGIETNIGNTIVHGIFDGKAYFQFMNVYGGTQKWNLGTISYNTTESPFIIRSIPNNSIYVAGIVALKQEASPEDALGYFAQKYMNFKKLPLVFNDGIAWRPNT